MATTTVTGLFAKYVQARDVVRDLESEGIRSEDISVVANNADDEYTPPATGPMAESSGAGTGAGVGAVGGGAVGLLTGLGIMAIPGVGPVVAAGWLAATALGAVAGAAVGGVAGGLTDALVSSGVNEAHAPVYSEGVRRGGALVVVKTDDTRASAVQAILDRHDQRDIAEARANYEETGWGTFDPNAAPWTSDQIRDERNRII